MLRMQNLWFHFSHFNKLTCTAHVLSNISKSVVRMLTRQKECLVGTIYWSRTTDVKMSYICFTNSLVSRSLLCANQRTTYKELHTKSCTQTHSFEKLKSCLTICSTSHHFRNMTEAFHFFFFFCFLAKQNVSQKF